MGKQKLIIVGLLVFAVGLGTGYLMSRYVFNAQLSESEAAPQSRGGTKACTGTPDPEIAIDCASLATEGPCKAAGCTWGESAPPTLSIGIQNSVAPE